MDTVGKKVVELRIEDVLPNRFQPRIKFNEDAINELSKSIKEHGVIQPIVVRPIGDKYEIIAGERRYKASCMAELKTIPAIITDLNDKDSAEVALIENVQREDLTPIEEAISYKKILDMGYITQDALATKLGKTQSTVANKLRLLNLDDEVQEALLNEQISERHARSLLKLSDKTKQKELLNKIIAERLTVRKTDDEIDKMINGTKEETITTPKFINNIEENEINEEKTMPKFINIPEENKETIEEQKSSKFINVPIEEEQEEIKPAKFFNILDEEENKPEETKSEEQKEPVFNFDDVFNNPTITPIEQKATDNNALLEELNEIENSIKNSNILEEQPEEPEKQKLGEEGPKIEEQKDEQPIQEEADLNTIDDDMEFIEEFEEEKEEPEITTMNEIISKPTINISELKDAIQLVRECTNEIEKAGFRIDTEEIDLENEYQIIIKIEK